VTVAPALGIPTSIRNRITQYVIKGVGNAGMQANVQEEKEHSAYSREKCVMTSHCSGLPCWLNW